MIKIGSNQFLFVNTDTADVSYDSKLSFDRYTVFLGRRCRSICVGEGDRSLLILGYICDASSNALSERELAEKLLIELDPDGLNIAECFCEVGGRYTCFAIIKNRLFVWNDACGLKQVFYDTDTSVGRICAASQARYIAQLKAYKQSEDAAEYFDLAQKQAEFSLPLSTTLYQNVRRLLPNHFLTDNGQPQQRMSYVNHLCCDLPENKQVDMIADLLRNVSESVSAIFRLAVTLTGGLDSRLALTALGRIKDRLDVITLAYVGMPEDHYDLTIPKQFCQRFGFRHRVIRCQNPHDSFVARYTEHSEHPHRYWMQMSEAVDHDGEPDRVLVKGSCSEIAQCPNGILPDRYVTPELLCKLFELPITDYSLKEIERWLESAESAAKDYHIPLLSLFYWEHRMGSWLAECLNEGDVATEVFTPFNVRKTLMLMNGLPAEKRIPPDFKLFMQLLERCEKGSSQIAINPGRYSAASKPKLLIKYKMPFLYKTIILSGRM